MFSTFISHTPFLQNRRLERPLHQNNDTNAIKDPRRTGSVIIHNLNLTFGNLNSMHPELRSNTSLQSSFISSSIFRPVSTSSKDIPSCRPSFETDKTSPLSDTETNLMMKAKLSSTFTEIPSYTSRPSFESDTGSSCSWLDSKKRKSPPPPLFLNCTNLHRKQPSDNSPVIEIIVPGPPRVDSRLSSYTVITKSPQFLSPISPELPSEEEIRRRMHEKVMRTLGEQIPVELVYRGAKIPNVTIFPEPSPPADSQTTPHETTKSKLSRRRSFTLAAFPNISSVTAMLASHTRTKPREKLEIPSPTTLTLHPISRQKHRSDVKTPLLATYRSMTYPRPERSATVYSPIVFASVNELNNDEEKTPSPTMDDKEAERAEKLARRASLSTATFFPTSPMRDGFRDYDSQSQSLPSNGQIIVNPPPRRESMGQYAPEEGFSLVVSNVDKDATGAGEKEDDNDDTTGGSQTPPELELYAQSATSLHSHSHSTPHLALHVPLETPLQNSGVLVGDNSEYLAPRWTSQRKGSIRRKEKRQGWSGEWNQGDMQDVIRKLRNLK